MRVLCCARYWGSVCCYARDGNRVRSLSARLSETERARGGREQANGVAQTTAAVGHEVAVGNEEALGGAGQPPLPPPLSHVSTHAALSLHGASPLQTPHHVSSSPSEMATTTWIGSQESY
eukprot:3487094-Rhodomonas_salina.1